MARRFWIVCCPEIIPLYEGVERGQHLIDRGNRENYGIFFTKQHADAFAQKLSTTNPGSEIQVAESVYGFHAPAAPKTTMKVWNNEGEYVLP